MGRLHGHARLRCSTANRAAILLVGTTLPTLALTGDPEPGGRPRQGPQASAGPRICTPGSEHRFAMQFCLGVTGELYTMHAAP